MSPSANPAPAVALLDVSEPVLEHLLELALRDADADEVTPPLGSAAGWNTDRISWFREFHRAAAAGLDGPARQKSWAISCDGRLAGSIRLRRTAVGRTESPVPMDGPADVGGADGGGAGKAPSRPAGSLGDAAQGGNSATGGVLETGISEAGGGVLETGIWLGRSFRGRGVGREALRLVKSLAASTGAHSLVAETTAGNVGALALLRSAGANFVTGADSDTATVPVVGRIQLH